jgi:hypothetical protein
MRRTIYMSNGVLAPDLQLAKLAELGKAELNVEQYSQDEGKAADEEGAEEGEVEQVKYPGRSPATSSIGNEKIC